MNVRICALYAVMPLRPIAIEGGSTTPIFAVTLASPSKEMLSDGISIAWPELATPMAVRITSSAFSCEPSAVNPFGAVMVANNAEAPLAEPTRMFNVVAPSAVLSAFTNTMLVFSRSARPLAVTTASRSCPSVMSVSIRLFRLATEMVAAGHSAAPGIAQSRPPGVIGTVASPS